MHQPWIPHFGNDIQYTTVAEDRVNDLKAQLDAAVETLLKEQSDKSNRTRSWEDNRSSGDGVHSE